jgi:hypothetical protein
LDEGAAELAHWCRRRRYWLPVVPRSGAGSDVAVVRRTARPRRFARLGIGVASPR